MKGLRDRSRTNHIIGLHHLRVNYVAGEAVIKEEVRTAGRGSRKWLVAGAGEEDGAAAMAAVAGGGEEKGDGRGFGQEGYRI
ncbi:hypothetical protein BHE74_00042091 [Ensete ventricosum]|nr:hypothetical protein BHE74_00042091 [Ensete ventricosum]